MCGDEDKHSAMDSELISRSPLYMYMSDVHWLGYRLSPKILHVRSQATPTPSQRPLVRMTVRWSYNTGRCVDASPLVVREGLAPPTVFIGSHSGVFVSLCVSSGNTLWQTRLGDRIESSACLSQFGALVIVGKWRATSIVLNWDISKKLTELSHVV